MDKPGYFRLADIKLYGLTLYGNGKRKVEDMAQTNESGNGLLHDKRNDV